MNKLHLMPGYLLTKVLLLLALIVCSHYSFSQSDVVGKVTVGYQGWFAATGDGSPINAWWHWTTNWSQPPSSSNNGIKSWPDVRDYTTTYATAWPNLNNGQPAKLFSSFNDQTVNVQFQWMQQNGIDCAALQRFNPTGGEGPVRDAITAKVKTAAEATGRKFYIMYDVTDWFNMQSEIKNDWTTKMSAYTSSSAYARHNGKPVVCIWGFGFNDNDHPWTADVCLDVINWFKNQGCYVIGGVPREWRLGSGGSRPGFSSVYHAFNMISPWLIGAVGTISGADGIYNDFFVPDQADCNANGIAYQPCVLPGDLQERQRVHGDFMWRMFYNAIRAGCQGIYISMFDEYNEGNQIAKTAENSSQVPAGSGFLGLDEDGIAVSSDYYLRVTGDGGRMLKGQIALTATRPTPYFVNSTAPVITSASSASGTVNTPFTYNITASNSPTSYGASSLPPGLNVNTSTGVISGTPTTAGTFNATVSATNASGTGSATVAITINNQSSQTLPGTIQAENYCAMSGIQLETTTDNGGGQDVGWIDGGDWLDYCVNITTTGTYTVSARVASPNSGGQFQMKVGSNVLTTLNVPNTGGWQTWTNVTSTLNLTAGTQTIRLQVITGGFNINWLQFALSNSQSAYPNGTPWAIPGTIEVENYDNGGEGVAYHDNEAANQGGQYRTTEGVDVEVCSEGGYNVGWTNTGEWLEYTVNVAATGNYNIDVREASTLAGGTFHIEFNGVDKTGLFTTTNTGAWQTWTTLSKTGIALTAGIQVMRIYFDNANFNLNKVTFTSVSGNVAVTGVSVSPTTATINAGATQQLMATVAPSNATNQSVTWSSSNTGVATVSSSGLVTGVAAGSATITVTTVDGGKTATSAITVNVPAGTISCKKTSVAITVNGTLSETSWSSSVVNNSIAKVTTGTVNNTATFGVLWDNTNLYIGAKILDANLFSDSPNQWDDDAVEIYIDANNNKSTTYDGLDNQIIKNYNQSGVFTKLSISGLQHAWAAISGGYSVEIAVPWSALGISAPAQGTTIGFDIGYDDDDNGGTRDGQAVWNGDVNNYQNTSKFGSVVLSNTTAREAVEEQVVVQDKKLSWWPTIVEHDLNIQTDGSYHAVEVIDMLGRVHYRDVSIKGKKSLVLDLNHLVEGVHLVRLRSAESSQVIRIIKK